MPLRRPVARATVLLAVTAAALGTLLTAGPAQAADGRVGVRETVCADDLYVRVSAPDGAWTGTLRRGQTFLVEADLGTYVAGFAYGDVNRRGYVQNGWFC